MRWGIRHSEWCWAMSVRRWQHCCGHAMSNCMDMFGNDRGLMRTMFFPHMNHEGRKPQVVPGRASLRGIVCAVFAVALASAIGWPLHHRIGLANTNVLML